MKSVFLVLAGVALINATASFFGCNMVPATLPVPATTSTGNGRVVCYSGTDDSVAVLACSWDYGNLTSDITAAHFHVGNTSTSDGPIAFAFDTDIDDGLDLASSGNTYQKSDAANDIVDGMTWTAVPSGTSFASQITMCASGGCYFNLHTENYLGGELRCQLAPITVLTYDFDVTLSETAGATFLSGQPASTGTATVQMGNIPGSPYHAWGYQVSFTVQSDIVNAHIHQGTSETDNTGSIVVKFDQGTERTSGNFVGVALEGVIGIDNTLNSNWPLYNVHPAPANFDAAIASHFCYVNIHTVTNGLGEIRGNVSPTNSASQASLAALAIVFTIASWMSL
jgi:hypothetical protein